MIVRHFCPCYASDGPELPLAYAFHNTHSVHAGVRPWTQGLMDMLELRVVVP